MEDVVWFNKVGKNDVDIVGGKGANLGELTKIGASVPDGFIVTAGPYFKAAETSGALDRIRGLLYDLDAENPTQLETKAKLCQQEIKKIQLDSNFEKKLYSFYHKLSPKSDALVAVRSSATAEDLPQASFAGQQSTYLNVKGEEKLKESLLSAWASLFEARAIFYRATKNFDHFKVGIAICVQKMIQSEVSGIMFTIDPVTSDRSKVVIEAIFGLGELIVGGRETPDHYEISKDRMEIIAKTISVQNNQLVKSRNGNMLIKVSKKYKGEQKLDDALIIELAKVGKTIEKHYFFPQDIEWALEKEKLYIVQSRPVTTINSEVEGKKLKANLSKNEKNIILTGAPASPVIGTGKVIIIKNPAEISKVEKGDVLVTEMTNPDFVPAMKKAAAIVTNRGGRTSHAAIVSRELGIACVVGTEKATKVLKNGMIVTVDGAKGIVYKGQMIKSGKAIKLQSQKTPVFLHKTATKLLVNLAEPSLASQVASQNVDGVGLLRAEFILAEIGTHPKKFIEDGKSEKFVEELAEKMVVFGKAFGARPVIYRATDLKSNEYKNLRGGQRYEPEESNPMLGFRGAFRFVKDPDVFKLELAAIKKARAKHKNLHLMVPFVRTAIELKAVKNLVMHTGLFEDPSFKFYMMVEIPTNVISIEDFIKVGLDGISIGSNDLTMLILGIDRDNEEVASEFNELDPSVLWAFKRTIETASKYKVSTSICGQAPSVYPELTQMLVKWGISSISVNPDAISITRQHIYEAERNLIS